MATERVTAGDVLTEETLAAVEADCPTTPETVRHLMDELAKVSGEDLSELADSLAACVRKIGAAYIARDAEVHRLTAALDGVRREERALFRAWLKGHEALVGAWELANELQEDAWPVELLTEPDPTPELLSREEEFTLTIRGKAVSMTVAEVSREEAGRPIHYWLTTVGTKAAGLRTYDHRHSGNSRMEAIGWTLQVLAGEGMEPTAMTWGAPTTESAT